MELNEATLDTSINLEDILNESENLTQPKLSPLEEAMQQKNTVGMVVTNEELEKGKREIKNEVIGAEERGENIKALISEHDDFLEKRSHAVLLAPLKDQFEWVEAYEEINDIVINIDGSASFNKVTDPKYIRLRGKDEPLFKWEAVQKTSPDNVQTTTVNTVEEKEETSTDDAKEKTVEILIDKTGLGANFDFSDNEKAVIQQADIIRVREVKTVDLRTIKTRKSTKSFQETINSFDYSGTRVPMWFPASGFKAEFKGLTYGEYTDIAIAIEKSTFDNYHKELSIIYNKMVNPSCGEFKNFEDFIKNFAHTDVPLALYAIFMATESENQEITLQCGRDTCGKNYNFKYNTHSILKYNKHDQVFLDKFYQLASAPGADFDELYRESEVHNTQLIELPRTKYLVSVGIISAYDYLYNFTPLQDENTLKELFGPDPDEAYAANVALLTSINAFYLPDGTEFTGYKDILDAIYSLDPYEMQILLTYANDIQTKYMTYFSFGKTVCPHCGNVTDDLEFTIENLVFQKYQTLLTTSIDVKKVQNS